MNGKIMINFACVYYKNKKTIYTEEYIDKLYNGIKRNYRYPFKFTCLSNVETKYDTIKLENNWEGWWSKIELFRPSIFTDPVFYIDLDVIICQNIDSIIDKLDPNNFYMIRSVTPDSGNANSSIMSWSGDYSSIYHEFLRQTDHIKSKYRKGNLIGDQAYIQSQIKSKLRYIDKDFDDVITWNHWKYPDKNNKTSKFYIFCGSEKKPHLEKENSMVEKFWI